MTATELYNIKEHYLDDFEYTDTTLKIRSAHELGELQGLPENLSGKDKRRIVLENNKKLKVKSPLVSHTSSRPTLSDMEIALIVSSYGVIPTKLLAHTLNVPTLTINETYKKFKHEKLVQLPLVSIMDSSRYLSEDNERTIYNHDDMNHLDDPLTSKELLWQTSSEQKIDQKILATYIDKQIEKGNTFEPYTRLAGYFFVTEDVETKHSTLYGRTWSDYFTSIFKKGVLNTYTIPNKITKLPYSIPTVKRLTKTQQVKYIYHPPYTLTHNLYQHTHLLRTYLNKYQQYNTEEQEDSSFTYNNINTLNLMMNSSPNVTANMIRPFIYEPQTFHNNKVIYTTDYSKIRGYKPTNNEMYVPYNIVRPAIYNRAFGSPLQDKNNVLRYRFPLNTYTRLKSTQYLPVRVNHPYPAILCTKCQTLLSKHTVTQCKCKAVRIIFNIYQVTQENHKDVQIKNININLDKLKDTKLANKIKQILNIADNTKSIKSKQQYAYGKVSNLFYKSALPKHHNIYTSSIKYTHRFSSSNKGHIEVFTDSKDDIQLHLYNYSDKLLKQQPSTKGMFNFTPNVLPLYVQFTLPIHCTSQEPRVT
jgi:hypothetical protein